MTAQEIGSETLAGRVFVGRQRELEELHAGYEAAAAGHGKLFLIGGEPGIGKTRLAGEAAAHAAFRGARVLWGRCWEGGGAPAYWPWVQIVRAYARGSNPDALFAELGAGGEQLANLVPELLEHCPQLPPPPAAPRSLDSEHARFRLFDALAGFLRNAAARRPLVLIVDDIHAADRPSLLLLQFVARELADIAALTIVTYREMETRRTPWLAAMLGQLAREGRVLPLRGLGAEEVAEFVTELAQASPPERVLEAIHRTTEGNPFFIDEVVRLLVSEGRLLQAGQPTTGHIGIPDAVRETIRRRLDPLSEETLGLLRIAAVLGRQFDDRILPRICRLPADHVETSLAEARSVGALLGASGTLGQGAFSHPLIRETLYEDLPLAERRDLHRRVGEALAQTYRTDPEPHVAELAHHFLAALPAGDARAAIDYAARAGSRALSQLAYEDAAGWYERALRSEDMAAPDEARRFELFFGLGEARYRAGEGAAARQAFLDAASSARRLVSPADGANALARAALGISWNTAETGIIDDVMLELLEEALRRLPEEDSALRAGVLSRLAVALYFSRFADRRAALSAQAVDMARRLGDPNALATALIAYHFSTWGPGTAEDRLSTASELMRLGERGGSRDMLLDGRHWRIVDLLELGDVRVARVETDAYARLADELRLPRYRWHVRILRAAYALFEGRFAEAEHSMMLAFTEGERAEVANAAQFFGVQIFWLRREQSRLAELQPRVEEFAERYPALPIWRCGLAFLYTELDRLEAARRELDTLAGGRFADLPRDTNWTASCALLAEVCARLDDRPRAAALYELLLPHAARNVVVATGVALFGSVSYYLGLLAATAGDRAAAAAHFERAIGANTAMGAHPRVAYAQFAYARMLAAAGGTDASKARARGLLERSLDTARQLGMTAIETRAGALLASAETPVGAPGHAGESGTVPPAANVFRREGDYWTVTYAGTTLRLKDSRGLQYIGYLLRHADTELHCTELVASAAGAGTGTEMSGALCSSDTGEILDARARATYKLRLRELDEEIAEARACNDTGQAERAQDELDHLARELAASAGLGGRSRRTGSAAERSRISVTKAIGAALKHIAAHHGPLASHLSTAIKTGTFCSYTHAGQAPATWAV